MIYPIETSADLSGVKLTVRFPEEDLDRKALYTIQADPPGFLIPFRHRNIDGQVELTYHPGSRTKLQYRFGKHPPKEYIAFWKQLLFPLLDCGDWFCKPSSFVLEAQYLYFDRDSAAISYLYIPTRRDLAGPDALQNLAIELSRQNSVTDPAIENQVLKAVLKDFQPRSFLEMLRQFSSEDAPPAVFDVPSAQPAPAFQATAEHVALSEAAKVPVSPPKPAVPPAPKGNGAPDEIVIRLDGGPPAKKQKKESHLFGEKKDKAKKQVEKKNGGLFQKKKRTQNKEILLGAAVEAPNSTVAPRQVSVQFHNAVQEDSVTELVERGGGDGPCLRLVGDASLPPFIYVNIAAGASFTIGRFDVTVGYRQSDFEFDRHTRAVSRHHAAIERGSDGNYSLVDLSSSDGSYVDGERLTPNVPHPLHNGCRVAFGTAGATYIWEEVK